MVVRAAGEAIRCLEIPVLVGVRVAAEADAVGVAGDGCQEVARVRVGRAGLGAEQRAERNVQRVNHQAVARHRGEHGLHKRQLLRSEPALVFAEAVRLGWVGAKVFHVIELEERRSAILERAVAGAEHALERLSRSAVVRRLEVHVVVAGANIPGHPHGAGDTVIAVIDRQIVEHHVAMVQAEGGVHPAGLRYDVIADVVHFGQRLGLRVGEQDHIELGGFVLPVQCEVDAVRQFAGWRQPGKAGPERRGRALRRIDIGAAGQVGDRVQRSHPAARLDEEHRIPGVERQAPTPIRPRRDDLAAVGDEDTRHAGTAARALVGSIGIGEHHTGCGHRSGLGFGACGRGRHRQPGRAGKGRSARDRHGLAIGSGHRGILRLAVQPSGSG